MGHLPLVLNNEAKHDFREAKRDPRSQLACGKSKVRDPKGTWGTSLVERSSPSTSDRVSAQAQLVFDRGKGIPSCHASGTGTGTGGATTAVFGAVFGAETGSMVGRSAVCDEVILQSKVATCGLKT